MEIKFLTTPYLIKNKTFKGIFRIMKICFILLFVFSFQLMALNTEAQEAVIELRTNSITVGQLIEEIEKQTDYLVVYSNREIDANRKVSLRNKSDNVSAYLDEAFAGTDIGYDFENNYIVLMKKANRNASTIAEMIRSAQQQGKTITGKVTDINGEPIIGATILIKGTSHGTVTDMDGNYTLTNVPEDAILQFSYVGMESQEISVDGKTVINVTMKEAAELLEEVVVVGYGTIKKRDLTGAVASVKMDDSPVNTISTVIHALAGKAAGLQVSTISAQPGGQATFRVRGAASSDNVGNNPLIIIDGFPVSDPGNLNVGSYSSGNVDNILLSINANDIESIEILKDASSTAIYGARAGNGVIIVTTKKGKAGKPTVKYSGSSSWQKMAKSYEMLNPVDFMRQVNRYGYENWMLSNKIAPYGNADPTSVEAYIPKYSQEQIANPVNQTDWLGEVTRPGFQTQHNISVNGGNENTKYMISGNYFIQNGVIKNNNLDRVTSRINIDQKLSEKVKTGINFTISRNTFDNVPLGSGQNENAPILVGAVQFNPLLPIKNENGEYQLNPEAMYMPNPVSLLEIANVSIKERLLANVYLEAKPIKNLLLRANFGVDRNYQKMKTYLPKTTLPGRMQGGKADIGQSDQSDYLLDLTATYTKEVEDHTFTTMVGHSFQQFDWENLSAGNSQFLTDVYLFNNIGAGVYPKPWVGSSANKNEIASFFGRINYSFKDRYLITATMRLDGASNFNKDHRWGYFPSISAGWRFIDEEFAQSLTKVLSNGKLRIGYGVTGKSNIGNAAISFYREGNSSLFGNEVESKGVYMAQLGNPKIKWEQNKELNIGLDLGFLNNRINLVAEYFNKVVDGWLSQRSLQSYMIVSQVADNIGSTQSRGFELTINSQSINRRDFSWSTDFTYSFYKDTWKDRGPYWKPSTYSIYNAPLRGSYGYLSDGLVQASDMDANGKSTITWMPGVIPGQVKIKDIDGFERNEDGTAKVGSDGRFIKTGKPDGKLDDADKVFYGSNDPQFIFGLNNTLRYKNWDLNIYFYGQFNKLNFGSYQDLWLTGANGMTGVINIYRGYNMPTSITDVWTHDNSNATRPGFFQDKSTYGIGDFYLKKIWFVRAQNITLGYTLPENIFFSNTRLYIDINNPFILTNYKGLDPETDSSVWAYPNVRTVSLGIDINF